MCARAHWPNVAQTDLIVVVVIIGVVVAVVVDVSQRNSLFWNSGQTDRHTDCTVYRVALQLKMIRAETLQRSKTCSKARKPWLESGSNNC